MEEHNSWHARPTWCICSDRYVDPGLSAAVSAAPGVQCERQQGVFNQDGHGFQDEGGKQVHVDVVPHAVELPGAHEGRCE